MHVISKYLLRNDAIDQSIKRSLKNSSTRGYWTLDAVSVAAV